MTRTARAVVAVGLWLTIPSTFGCDSILFCSPRSRTVRVGPGGGDSYAEVTRLREAGWDCSKVFQSHTGKAGDGTYQCTKCG